MLLACDIGNTNIKTGLFKREKLEAFYSFNSYSLFLEYLKSITFNRIAISSVVPSITGELKNDLTVFSKAESFIIDKSVNFNLKISYDSFDTLGIE